MEVLVHCPYYGGPMEVLVHCPYYGGPDPVLSLLWKKVHIEVLIRVKFSLYR